ncbi:MAG: hypothetical protein ABIA21_03110 [Candidatus Aenigmatarchaeota archaeon]
MFFGKKKHKEPDFSREDVTGELEEPQYEPTPETIGIPDAPIQEPQPAYTQSRFPSKREMMGVAPMFIKVEKYKEIIDALQEIKNFSNGIKQLFVALTEIESIRNDAMKMLRVSVQRMEKATVDIDQELLKPIGVDIYPHGEAERGYLESSMVELQEQIAKLRSELQAYRG